jgi:hypothetical protein
MSCYWSWLAVQCWFPGTAGAQKTTATLLKREIIARHFAPAGPTRSACLPSITPDGAKGRGFGKWAACHSEFAQTWNFPPPQAHARAARECRRDAVPECTREEVPECRREAAPECSREAAPECSPWRKPWVRRGMTQAPTGRKSPHTPPPPAHPVPDSP